MVEVKGYAKINLMLDVIGKRDDGYHEVRMLMQQVDLCDIITVSKAKGRNISLTCDKDDIPLDESNLAFRAAMLMKDAFSIEEGVEIHIEKNIPVAAGLAGGSTDAAAVLKGMNQLFQLELMPQMLWALGRKLGADVPFCILGKAAIATGVGEKLEPVTLLTEGMILLCKPPVMISTKEVYEQYSENIDTLEKNPHPDLNKLIKTIQEKDYSNMHQNMINVLEHVVRENHPEITMIEERLKAFEPEGTLMSGSGPTVFAYFLKKEKAQEAYRELKKRYPETYLTNPIY